MIGESSTEGNKTNGPKGTTDESRVTYFWTRGAAELGDGYYHTLRSCAWLLFATWTDGQLETSDEPPADDGRGVEPGWADEDWWESCPICDLYIPDSAPFEPSAVDNACVKCGCDREMHQSCRSMFDRGCGMAWPQVDQVGPDPDDIQVGLIHCNCDGYLADAHALSEYAG